jgi:hypothetical protein
VLRIATNTLVFEGCFWPKSYRAHEIGNRWFSDARRRPTGIRTRYKRCNAAEGDVARRLGIVVGREDGGKLPCKGSAPVFHSHRKCWDIASRRKTALLAGSGASAALAIGERFDLPGFIMDFTSLMPNKSLEPTAVGRFSSAFAVHVVSRRWLSFLR